MRVRCDNNGMHAKLKKRKRGVLGKSRSIMMVVHGKEMTLMTLIMVVKVRSFVVF